MKTMSPAAQAVLNRVRRGQRGATFVEALMVIMVLIIVNASLLFLMSIYSTKLYTMRKVREEVWVKAATGCMSPGGADADTSNTGAPPDGSLAPLQGVAAGPAALANGVIRQTLTQLQRQQTGARTSKTSDSTMYFNGLNLSTSNTVFCNEIPRDFSEMDQRQINEKFYNDFIGN